MTPGWRYRVSSLWHRPVASLRRSSRHMQRWFKTPLGQEILQQEIALIEQCRREYSSDLLVQVSGSGCPLLGKPTNKRQKVVLSSHAPRKSDGDLAGYSWLVTDFDKLPYPESSVDFMVLHHALEFSDDPHAVLREAVRVLAPQGHLVVICFNPHSLFGLLKSFKILLRNQIPWAHHRLSLPRLSDWLHLMSCPPLNTAGGFYGLPIQWRKYLRLTSKLDGWFAHLGIPMGGFYVVHASKEMVRPLLSERRARKSRLIQFPATASAVRAKLRVESSSDV